MENLISLIISQSEIIEYLNEGFYSDILSDLKLKIEKIEGGKFGEFYLYLKGSNDDLKEFLLFYGYDEDEIYSNFEIE
jgi:hypothetical protein